MKVLVVLNEKQLKDASDVHNAMDLMVQKGIVTDYHIYSYIYEMKSNSKSSEVVVSEICDIAIKDDMDMVLWMHPQLLSLDKNMLTKIQKLKEKNIVIGLWDGDIFGKFIKHTPKTLMKIGALSDVSFVQGVGYFFNKLKKIGSKNVEFVPAVADQNRFDINKKVENFKYDIVLIGNNYKKMFNFLDMKGSKLRRKIVELFSKEFGGKFAVYGIGWDRYSSNKGVIDYNKQLEVYHKSKIALGTNNPSAKYYFSDRLPIAMLSGKPVVYNYEEGLGKFFEGSEVYFYKDEYEALEMVEKLLKNNDEYFENTKYTNSEFAKSKLTMDHLMEYMISYMIALKNNSEKPKNPWIN